MGGFGVPNFPAGRSRRGRSWDRMVVLVLVLVSVLAMMVRARMWKRRDGFCGLPVCVALRLC